KTDGETYRLAFEIEQGDKHGDYLIQGYEVAKRKSMTLRVRSLFRRREKTLRGRSIYLRPMFKSQRGIGRGGIRHEKRRIAGRITLLVQRNRRPGAVALLVLR